MLPHGVRQHVALFRGQVFTYLDLGRTQLSETKGLQVGILAMARAWQAPCSLEGVFH